MNSEINDDLLPSAHFLPNPLLAAVFWSQTNEHRWDMSDGAAVKYRDADNYMYAKPWLKGHRGWVAYSPTEERPLSYKTKRGFNVAIKYKSAQNAMAEIDRQFPNSR